MTSRTDPRLERLLEQERYVRSLARVLLSDSDEVEQRTWLYALQHGTDGVAKPRSWLGRVARNAARDVRRGAARRRAHEQGAAREPTVPSTAELVEREESRRALIAAVDALPEGARTAIWLRYFEEMPPRDIATHLGIPVTTVWTQLRRGLSALRERLGNARDRRVLLAPLLTSVVPPSGVVSVAAGTSAGSPVAAAGWFSWISLLYMTTKTKLVALATLALVLVAAFVAWPGAPAEGPPQPVAALVPDAMRASSSVEAVGAAVAIEPPPESDPSGTREVDASVPPPDPVATMRGRCVDPDGRPLAGVKVRLHGWGANQQRRDAYQRDHGEFEWADPEPVTTGGDGLFAFSFWPPPPLQFALDLEHPDWVSMSGRWSGFDAGSELDLGDIRFSAGSKVGGAVVDRDGKSVSPTERGTLVSMMLQRPFVDGRIGPKRIAHAFVRPDGGFAVSAPVEPGTWRVVSTAKLPLIDVRQVVEVEAPSTRLKVVVRRPVDTPTISGVVVDTTGQPVFRASVLSVESPWGAASSGRDGRFELKAGPRIEKGARTRIQVSCKGYEKLVSGESFAWGSSDLHLELTAGQVLEIRVVRASDGTPVERFGTRLEPAITTSVSSEYDTVRGGWDHEGGVLRVPGVLRGRCRVSIEPTTASGLVETIREIEVGDFPLAPLTVRLPTAIAQPVDVQTADGEPVLGSVVELIEAEGESIGPGTKTRRRDVYAFPRSGRLVDEAKTDAHGRAVVRGAPGQKLVLRVTGAHAPVVMRDVLLSEQPRVIEVTSGAALQLELKPRSVMEDWRRVAAAQSNGPSLFGRVGPAHASLFRLVGATPETRPAFGEPPVTFDEHGQLCFRNVPQGRWAIRLTYPVTATISDTIEVGDQVTLRRGETVKRSIDLSRYRTGDVRLRALVGGEPATGSIQLTRRRPPGDSRTTQVVTLALAADGTVRQPLPVGRWTSELRLKVARGWCALPTQPVVVLPGQATAATLTAVVGRARMRVLGPDGRPCSRVTVIAKLRSPPGSDQRLPTDAAGAEFVRIAQSDANGEIDWVGRPGTYALEARIRSLSEQGEFNRFCSELMTEHGADPDGAKAKLERAAVAIGEIDLGDSPGCVVVTLPAGWDR